MFSHRYRYLFIVLLSLYTFMNTVLCSVYYYFKIDIEWYYALLTILTVTFLTWEGNRMIKPWFKKKFLTPKTKIRFLGFFFLAGNIVAVIAACIAVFLFGSIIHEYTWEQNLNPLKLNIIYGSLINLFLHLLNAILFFFREYRRHWKEAEELRQSSTQAQIQLVKSQINPHFLFNNLNVLSGMVIKDNPEANQFIEEFSKVYRYILNNQEKEIVELRSELEFIQPYIFLLQKRFDNGLTVKVNIPDHYKSWHIVPAALQMLIENAIKHNVVSRSKPLHIDIYTNGNQTLVIKNNLQPRMMVEASTRIGLQNIRKRYELISGRDVIVKKTDQEFEVVLPLLQLN
ncbi:MAG TPA: histidine kinase [Chitinophagaceae bacterium]|nr:histidine kinase [Chitinophagaceae bacterium]HNU12955.1 histidine kinase [Chitinophagaceae bacterium]